MVAGYAILLSFCVTMYRMMSSNAIRFWLLYFEIRFPAVKNARDSSSISSTSHLSITYSLATQSQVTNGFLFSTDAPLILLVPFMVSLRFFEENVINDCLLAIV